MVPWASSCRNSVRTGSIRAILPEKVKNAANVTSSPQSTPSSARRSSTSSAAVMTASPSQYGMPRSTMAAAVQNSTPYTMHRRLSTGVSCAGTVSVSRGISRQQARISAVDSRNGGSMMVRNSPLGIV